MNDDRLRVLLVGSRSFGEAALIRLLTAGHDVVGTIAPRGDPLHKAALAAGRSRPMAVDSDAPRAIDVKNLRADLIVCAHAHQFISSEARSAASLGAIGYHPSLLPRHRGRDAVRWTIKMGDPIAGGTVYWFDDGVDTGPILAQDWCHVVPGWDSKDLWREALFPMGLSLISEVLTDIESGAPAGVAQDERVATWEPSLDVSPLPRG